MIEQTKAKPQETLDFKMKKQIEPFSFATAINFPEEGKWLLGVPSFETTNSVFNTTSENNSFSISTPCFWDPGNGEELFSELNNL